jgi:hypothetical protein
MSDISGINGASGFSSFFNRSSDFSGAKCKADAADFDPSLDIQDPTYASSGKSDAVDSGNQSGDSSNISQLVSQLIAFLTKLLKSLDGEGDDQQDGSSSDAGDIQDPPPPYTADSSPPPYTPPAGASGDSSGGDSANGPTPISNSEKTSAPAPDSSSGSNGASGDFSTNTPTGLNSESQTKDMEKNLVKSFMDKGLTQNQAIGVVASLKEESGLNTAIRQGGAFDTDPNSKADVVDQTGFGLAQWGEDRLQNLQKYADDHKLPASSQAAQVGFMMQEAQSMGVLDQIKNGPDDASAACATWTKNYEKAAAPNMDTRLANIAQIQSDIGA